MKVICSWCKSEGRPALMGEKVPLADLRETTVFATFTSNKWAPIGSRRFSAMMTRLAASYTGLQSPEARRRSRLL